jgi:uncharacterized protein with PIN domain
MEYAYLHFHATLKDFISPVKRNQIIAYAVDRHASIKDVIESCNVPHTEIDLIIVNGVSVDFDYSVQHSDEIHVYPVCSTALPESAGPLHHLSPPIPENPRFIVDANLGRLARYLRLLGFDCLYRNDFADQSIAEISCKTQRIVLTRDRKLLKRKIIIYGYYVRADIPKAQVRETLNRFNLYTSLAPLTRCTHCNGKLINTGKPAIAHRLKPLTRQYYDKFLLCSECHRIYWQGSHCARVDRLIKDFCSQPVR